MGVCFYSGGLSWLGRFWGGGAAWKGELVSNGITFYQCPMTNYWTLEVLSTKLLISGSLFLQWGLSWLGRFWGGGAAWKGEIVNNGITFYQSLMTNYWTLEVLSTKLLISGSLFLQWGLSWLGRFWGGGAAWKGEIVSNGIPFYQSLMTNYWTLEVLSSKLLISGSLFLGALGSFDVGGTAIQGLAWTV